MKKIISIFIILTFMCLSVSAQEPGNNLGMSFNELCQKFPDLVSNGSSEGASLYKSPKSGVLFEIKDGIVIEESTWFFPRDINLQDLYYSLLNSFSQYKGKVNREQGSSYDITRFYYSYFRVKIAYYYSSNLWVNYCLNKYNSDIGDARYFRQYGR